MDKVSERRRWLEIAIKLSQEMIDGFTVVREAARGALASDLGDGEVWGAVMDEVLAALAIAVGEGDQDDQCVAV